MEIRTLTAQDAAPYWHLRLAALRADPRAFGKSAMEHEQISIATQAERLLEVPEHSFTLGAFVDDALIGTELIGMATFMRDGNLKERHKGHVFGVYVAASHRGTGVGRALMSALIAKARDYTGLEQILLAVAVPQTAARNLYRSLGFEVFGTEPRALKVGDEYVDEEHMILRLH